MAKKKNDSDATTNTTAPEEVEVTVVIPETFLVAAPNGLNLREGAGKDHAVLTILADRARVVVSHPLDFAEVPGWVRVQSEDLRVGWVQAEFLCRLPEE